MIAVWLAVLITVWLVSSVLVTLSDSLREALFWAGLSTIAGYLAVAQVLA